jgi:hypothetical protein
MQLSVETPTIPNGFATFAIADFRLKVREINPVN